MTAVVDNLAMKPHNACFMEIANAFSSVLPEAAPQVIFGANDGNLSCNYPGAILYNAEALWILTSPYKLIARNVRDHVIWDYAETNVERWHSLGLRAVYCPIGYAPVMEMIAPVEVEDVDVLFYGWVNDRRLEILRALEASGLHVHCLRGVYGAERDSWIARSKVVLNLHFYDHSIFEIFRVSHLLANHKCVVTEAGGKDETLESLAKRTCAYASREQIVEACQALVADKAARQVQAAQGYAEFKKISLADNVRRAWAAS